MSTLDAVIKKFNIDVDQPSPIMLRQATRRDLAQLLGELEYKLGAEIGVEQGVYSEILCRHNPGLKLYCIDPWQAYADFRDPLDQQQLDAYYQVTQKRLAPYHCQIIKQFSLEAAKQFAPDSLDFVYIDANHHFDYITPDIITWSEKVKSGGIVSGHDYRPDKGGQVPFHVIQATQAYTSAHKISPWFVMCGRGNSTWFWIKP